MNRINLWRLENYIFSLLLFSFFTITIQAKNCMDTTLIIKKERLINANTETVWNVLTNPVEIKKWLGVQTESDWTPGSEISFSFSWDGKDYTDKGKIIQFENEKIFSYSYWSVFSGLPDAPENYSKIEFVLVPTENGITLKLTHSDFATETMYKHSVKNWNETLDLIKKLCEK
jgi:uncharacterized protein YndB with AHSA1/START domain